MPRFQKVSLARSQMTTDQPSVAQDGLGETQTDSAAKKGSAGSNASRRGSELEPNASAAANDNPASDLRNMRRIIAEDPEWSLATVPLLTDLCIRHIVHNFEINSRIIDKLLPKHKVKVLEKISEKLPLHVTANLIQDEGYWKRCCKARWEICDVVQYGKSWKRMYFERNLQEKIEHFVPGSDLTEIKDTLLLSKNYVKKLDIRQLLPPVRETPKIFQLDDDDAASDAGEEVDTDHFDFNDIFKDLTELREFKVVYGVRDCGMNFEWNLFQFTARDCQQLSKCIASTKHLTSLSITRSKVDDDKIRVMISHILDHPGLTELDVSNNLIGDRGARAIGKFLNNHSQLVTICLADNQIRAAGASAIAHALTKNSTLRVLNIRLNRIGDEGGQAICKALIKNATLEQLNMGSNDLSEPTANGLGQVIAGNSVLKKIDISCNRIGVDGGKQLQQNMEDNKTVTHIDLRLTECGTEAEYCIYQILHTNRERERELSLQRAALPAAQ
ncbi:dynein regulatory complex subunit 5-like [Watersipora subatra]|uniref:dynein regulatory complex subunit 5-like n=1 Tax=Watersipora subatra TaxID=2589382 RepID=UPI00355C3CD9